MKKIIVLLLICSLLLNACATSQTGTPQAETTQSMSSTEDASGEVPHSQDSSDGGVQDELTENQDQEETPNIDEQGSGTTDAANNKPNTTFRGLDDESLLGYVEDNVYSELIGQLNSEDYFVENVEAIYYPKEYIEALTSNTQKNLYFGYTSDEINAQFQGKKYVFTLGEDGQTVVVPMETVTDDIYVKAMEDVIVGSGVILVCVTVSVVTAPAAPAVGMIFAASASTGTTFGVQSSVIGFVSAAIVKGYETESFDQAIKAGVEASAKGFKWGVVTGVTIGGVSKGVALHGAAKQTNFTMNQYARIQQETGYPLDVIKEFHTMEEYQVFRDAHLETRMIGNKSALVKTDIDLTRVDSKGRTNLERMKQGLAPQDSNGISYELHHIGQKKDGTLAILSRAEHDHPAIHGFLERTEAHAAGTNWDAERQAFWKAYAALFG